MSDIGLRDAAVYVVGVGAQTPVGRCAPATAAAVRAGISAYAEHPFMIDRHGEPMVVARADWLPEDLPVAERITSLAVDAAREALRSLGGRPPGQVGWVRAHLALSAETLPDAGVRGEVADTILTGAGLLGGPPAGLVAAGHAGGFRALEAAVRQLRGGEAEFALVGGADSWLDPETLEQIDAADRLHSVDQSWGFTPGEAAGFCLLATGAAARRLGLPPLAELLSVATAEEEKTMGTKTVCIGEGLTAAFRGALRGQPPVVHCYCDFNGETYRADEYGFAVCRVRERFDDPGNFTAAADCWGDVGAASGLLSVSLPVSGWHRGCGPAGPVLVWGSSAAGPLRGAATLNRVAARRG